MITLNTGSASTSPKFLGMGKPINATTVEEALDQGGLNWTVSKRPIVTTAYIPEQKEVGNPDLLTSNGTPDMEALRERLAQLLNSTEPDDDLKAIVSELEHNTRNTYLPHKNEFSIVRNDTNVPFGVLGRIYECLSNEECIGILAPLMAEGKVTVERAGHFNEGANCWILAKFPEVMTVENEIIDQYMRLSWSHDGTEKLSATFIAYLRRNNTQINPRVPGSQVSIEIRHTTNAKKRMELATNLLKKGASYFNALEDKLLELMNLPWTNEEMEEYLEALMPDSQKAIDEGKITQASRKRDQIMDIFSQSHPDIEHTKYAAFSSVAQWCDHEKPTRVTGQESAEGDEEKLTKMRNEARLQSIWMKAGTARKVKEDAWSILIK